MKKLLIVLLSLTVMTSYAHATLLTNGNFDDDLGLSSGAWSVYDSINGWNKGVGTSGIEVQSSTVITADTPNYYIELDSHYGDITNSSMYQTLNLSSGNYELSWMYHARTNNLDDDNGIEGYLTNTGSTDRETYLGFVSKTTSTMTSLWEEVTWTFNIATAGSYDLYFAAFGNDNTLGGFIDSAELNHAPVPEPSTILLLGSGLLGLGWYGRKRKKA